MLKLGQISCQRINNSVTNAKGLDASELLRVFESINSTPSTVRHDVLIGQVSTPISKDEEKPKKKSKKAFLSRYFIFKIIGLTIFMMGYT